MRKTIPVVLLGLIVFLGEFSRATDSDIVPDLVVLAMKTNVLSRDCRVENVGSSENYAHYSLNSNTQLWISVCNFVDSPNPSFRGFICKTDSKFVIPVKISIFDDDKKQVSETLDLGGATYSNGILSTFLAYDMDGGLTGQAIATSIRVDSLGKLQIKTLWISENQDSQADSSGNPNHWRLVYGTR